MNALQFDFSLVDWTSMNTAALVPNCCVQPATKVSTTLVIWGKGGKLTAVQRRLGEYWRRRDVRSIASGGIRLWKI